MYSMPMLLTIASNAHYVVLISNSFSERLFEPVREHLNWGKSRWKVEAKVENSPFRGLRKLLPFFPIRVRAK